MERSNRWGVDLAPLTQRLSLGEWTPLRVAAVTVAGVSAGVAVAIALRQRPAEGHEAVQAAEPDQAQLAVPTFAAALPVATGALRFNEVGTVAYAGLGRDLPPELPALAKEVGADPPGAFPGWWGADSAANPRPAGDTRGDEDVSQ